MFGSWTLHRHPDLLAPAVEYEHSNHHHPPHPRGHDLNHHHRRRRRRGARRRRATATVTTTVVAATTKKGRAVALSPARDVACYIITGTRSDAVPAKLREAAKVGGCVSDDEKSARLQLVYVKCI